jgi:hypothetical protein
MTATKLMDNARQDQLRDQCIDVSLSWATATVG